MQLAHSTDDGLSAVGIGVDFKGRIFLRELGERHAHLFLIGLGLRLDRNRNHWDRERDLLERNRMLFVADLVSSTDVLEANHSAAVARDNFLHVFALFALAFWQ